MRTTTSTVMATALLVLAAAVPLGAELKFTTRMQARESATPAPADPMLSPLGAMLTESMLPGGSLETTTIIGDKGMRVEWNKPLPGVPNGAVMLQRPDGTVIMIDPSAKTYWKMSADAVTGALAGSSPTVTTKKTGQFSEIAGTRCEMVTYELSLPIPMPAGAQAPQGFPSEVRMSGESCVAEKYRAYSKLMGRVPGISALGGQQLADAGLPMRQITRSAMFGAKEIESLITSIAEENVAASLFDIPAGFKEVPPPGGRR